MMHPQEPRYPSRLGFFSPGHDDKSMESLMLCGEQHRIQTIGSSTSSDISIVMMESYSYWQEVRTYCFDLLLSTYF